MPECLNIIELFIIFMLFVNNETVPTEFCNIFSEFQMKIDTIIHMPFVLVLLLVCCQIQAFSSVIELKKIGFYYFYIVIISTVFYMHKKYRYMCRPIMLDTIIRYRKNN